MFLKAIAAGLAIAAPVGPVGVLCLHRTIADGRLSGLVSGLGAALADAFFGVIAAFGVVAVADWMFDNQRWLELGGGALLLALGARTFLKPPSSPRRNGVHRTHVAEFISTFVLTITNPITLLAFAAVFASLGLGRDRLDALNGAVLVGGVFVGSALWWFGIAVSAGFAHGRMDDHVLVWVNRLSGALIFVLGVASISKGAIGF